MPRSALSKRTVIPATDRPFATSASNNSLSAWVTAFRSVRAETERRAAPLSAEDQVIQSMPDASPTKWHRAHVTWFFEQFLLRPFAPNYRVFDERFAYLFNSYYVAAGPRKARPQRGLVTRPTAAEVGAYRAHVDAAICDLIETTKNLSEIVPIIEISLHHEQQHQELLLTDILHAFSFNETHPVYDAGWQWPQTQAEEAGAGTVSDGVHKMGHADKSFFFDNEQPVHEVLLQPVRLSPLLVTNGEWLGFIGHRGYAQATLWAA